MRIALVEDNPEQLKMATVALAAAGHTILPYASYISFNDGMRQTERSNARRTRKTLDGWYDHIPNEGRQSNVN